VKVGDLVKVTGPDRDGALGKVGIFVGLKTIHYGGVPYPSVLIDGKHTFVARKNLEVISENR